MGNCFEPQNPNSQRDKEVNKIISRELKTRDELKLLLLGAGESGKSTIFKQMRIIHKKGFNDEEKQQFRKLVLENTLTGISTLIEKMEEQKENGGAQYSSPEIQSFAKELMDTPSQKLQQLQPDQIVEFGKKCFAVWKDPTIQQIYDSSSSVLPDSAAYFLNDVLRLTKKGYMPTEQDVLRTRMKTIGIVEQDFVIDGYKFRMVDVGGQRTERRKWIHVFDDVTAIIFVTSLSEYDQVLVEDPTQNRMRESLFLFEEIANCRFFKNTSIIIFFNKNDIFEEKIKKVDLKCCFPNYTGGKNYKPAIDYIVGTFLATNKNRNRQIYTRVTCATDTNNIKMVFDAVKNSILHSNLADANLI